MKDGAGGGKTPMRSIVHVALVIRDYAQAAEGLGLQSGWVYQRHFDHYLSSPLPFFAAVAGGLFAYHTGAGPIGGAAIAMAAGATTLVAGQFAFAHTRSTILRTMIAAAFA